MRLVAVILIVAALSSVSASSCDSPRRFLAGGAESQSDVYIRHGEEVQLVCRPSSTSGCRWIQGDNVLIDDCLLTASRHGLFRCMQGDELLGSVQLRTPPDQYVHHPNGGSRHYDKRWGSYDTDFPPESYHLCSDTGKIIDKHYLCDGTRHCTNGEDEEGCRLSCVAPAAGKHSSLTAPALQLYPDGAAVTYTCDEGFAFRETLSVLRRTCRDGRWSGEPPNCHRNVAFGRPGTADGQVMSGLDVELAVDGRPETWSMLAPTLLPQSLTVTLATNASVDLVLVRTLSPQFEVSLWSPDGAVECTCSKNTTDYPELTGLARCACPRANDGPVAAVVVRSPGSTFMSLSVAEIAAFEERSSPRDECVLDRAAHGSFQTVTAGPRPGVRLVCEAGYRATCGDVLPCRAAAAAACQPITCPPPPAISHAVIVASNGTGWLAATEYGCAAGYQLYPPEQNTTAVCADGLWSLSHISCPPESDIRVVALRLGQQHARSVAALRGELEALLSGQQQLLRQLGQTRRRLRRLEQEAGLVWEEEVEVAEEAELALEEGELLEEGKLQLLEQGAMADRPRELEVPPADGGPGQASGANHTDELQL